MKNLTKSLLAVCFTFLLASCSVSIKEYKDMEPKLNFKQYFNGKMIAHGYFKDRFGKIKKTFVVDMNTVWQGDTGVLTEHFVYNDGSKSERIWTLKIEGEKVIGTASDVVGSAVGEIAGNTLHWKYDLNLKVDESTYKVSLDDWMYLIDQQTMLNQSYMSKWGIDLGEIVLSMRKINE